jgi:hypothetical protein
VIFVDDKNGHFQGVRNHACTAAQSISIAWGAHINQ